MSIADHVIAKAHPKWKELSPEQRASMTEQARYNTFVRDHRFSWLLPVLLLVILPIYALVTGALIFSLSGSYLITVPLVGAGAALLAPLFEWSRAKAIAPEVLRLLPKGSEPVSRTEA